MSSTLDTTLTKQAQDLLAQIRQGDSVTLKDLVAAVAPPPSLDTQPVEPPLPSEITDDERAALAHIQDVYGSVVPSTRRMLEPSEIASLVDERETATTIKGMVERRIEEIKHAALNHFDVRAEQEGIATPGETPVNGDGHYLLDKAQNMRAGAPGAPKEFAKEARAGTPRIDPDALKAIAEDPEDDRLSHEDYLAMTTQVRVFDEHKAMLAIRKDPNLAQAVAAASETSAPSTSLYLRKPKK